MKALKIERLGDEVQGITLKGDRRNPEPTYVRIVLPFGDVDVARVEGKDGEPEYWVHVRVNRPGSPSVGPDDKLGRVVDARIDATDKHGGQLDAKLLDDPNLYHLAVRVKGSDR